MRGGGGGEREKALEKEERKKGLGVGGGERKELTHIPQPLFMQRRNNFLLSN